MQTVSSYVSGFLACAFLVLLGGTNTFSQNTVAPDNTSKAPVPAGSPEPKRSEKTPHTDTEKINAFEETLRQQGT
ncbi:MAG: hypothetical protein LC770_04875, partial [Acidobacteria bacterium]|nr:hypothetical protein [Acidobacteriota bacterium]